VREVTILNNEILLARFSVPGRPLAWRTAPSRRRGDTAAYRNFKAYQQMIQWRARMARPPGSALVLPYQGKVRVLATFFFAPLVGIVQVANGRLRVRRFRAKLPDLDILRKGLTDALQNALIVNDSQVVGTGGVLDGDERQIGEPERTEIEVWTTVTALGVPPAFHRRETVPTPAGGTVRARQDISVRVVVNGCQ
jgi:Holliday junction resolvase RusA-like endonuclease